MDDSPKHLLERTGRARPRRSAGPPDPPDPRERGERGEPPGARRGRAQPRCTRRSGTTTSTMCCTRRPRGEADGYYADYAGDTRQARPGAGGGLRLPGRGDALSRPAARRAERAHLPPTAFVAFIQNHDQIGNRAFGDRMTASAPPEAVRAVAAAYLLLAAGADAVHGRGMGGRAALPVLLRLRARTCGRGAQGPARGVRALPRVPGRATRERIPDPTAEATFASAKLAGTRCTSPACRWLDWYRAHPRRTRRPRSCRGSPVRRGREARGAGQRAVAVRWSFRAGAA